eukprot:TRINITY_DN43203_c0_g1_i1.p1 TRINITY_DN43203_c0_g1~~TRINITY_DN43203_c0_g1_i1.p1  ORF type:complete len:596 (-),score=102.27 TRINITY_DN43203_c0_g1_i1:123-1910(-)
MGVVTYDQTAVGGICGRLRQLVQESFQSHLYATAVFYADKLVSLNDEAEDLYTLAECYFKNKEYRRVLHLLRKHCDKTKADERLKLLAAQSLIECRDWEECLRYLEENTSGEAPASGDSKMASVFALLRGKVNEANENQENALFWYEKAVQLDPYCHEALDRLVGNHLLSVDKEILLVGNLRLHKEDEWLRHLYAAKLAGARGGTSKGQPEIAQLLAAYGGGSPTTASGASVAGAKGNPPTPFQPAPSPSPFDSTSIPEHKVAWSRGRQRRLKQATSDDSFTLEEYPSPLLPKALVTNGHTLTAQSTRYFYEGDFESCYVISKRVLEDDPYHLAVLPVHIASLVMMDMKSAVFYVAHQLVNAYPTAPVAWFTAGCYYFMVKKYEHARRFFHKAIALDHNFAPAWIAYGHAFAHHDESDQALAAYRTASRLFPGSQLPWLFIGMEYVRTNSLQLAAQCLECARSLAPTDPHVHNEIAVVAFHRKNYGRACDLLLQALRLPGAPLETIFSNLGHAYLKCKVYDRALDAFQQASRLNQRCSSFLIGVAFTLQLLGRPEEAIEYYHRGLSLQRDDAFATDMLNYAVQEVGERWTFDMEF